MMELSEMLCATILLLIVMIVALFLWEEYVKPAIKKDSFLGKLSPDNQTCLYGYHKNPHNLCNYA